MHYKWFTIFSGIEKIGKATAAALFCKLKNMMAHPVNLQHYYERAYENLIERDIRFHALDTTGLD